MDDDYIDCTHCGKVIPQKNAIFLNGMPFCENCHGEVDIEDFDNDDDDDDDDDD